jgi:hypothetical protein
MQQTARSVVANSPNLTRLESRRWSVNQNHDNVSDDLDDWLHDGNPKETLNRSICGMTSRQPPNKPYVYFSAPVTSYAATRLSNLYVQE